MTGATAAADLPVPPFPPRIAEGDTYESCLAALADERLSQMAGNPFFLTAMAALHRPDKELPNTGAELMHNLVTGVLEEARKHGTLTTPGNAQPELANLLERIPDGFNKLRGRLETVAYLTRAKRPNRDRRFVDEDMLKQKLRLAKDVDDDWVDSILAALRHRAGLLQSQDGVHFEFAYRFEEFLAGCHLANEDAWPELGFSRRAVELLKTQQDYARQVVIWAAGFFVHVRHRKGPVRDLVSALTPRQPVLVADAAGLANLELAAAIAGDAGMDHWQDEDVPDANTTIYRLRSRLEELRAGGNGFDAKTRAAAASALGGLGDPRPGVGLIKTELHQNLPDITWIDIPAGNFKMGGREDWQGKKEFECVLIKTPYRISRYPITCAQYHAFVKDGGYRDRRAIRDGGFWTASGLEWLTQNQITGPENHEPVFQTPNHPRVGVSWYEAFAFCRWLSQRTGRDLRLPSEAEWERAARGPHGRPYPWGGPEAGEQIEKHLIDHCNYYQTGIGHTSAVGLFAQGDTLPLEPGNQLGIADLAGNVWEWCGTEWLTNYQDYEKKVSDGTDGDGHRVLRGGSWFNDAPVSLLSSGRDYDPPDIRDGLVGFRVVSVSAAAR